MLVRTVFLLICLLFVTTSQAQSGVVDHSFNAGVVDKNTDGAAIVRAIAVQEDNKIILGGEFSGFRHLTRNNIVRLNPDGGIDRSFTPSFAGDVSKIVVQPDGKILVLGDFTTVNGVQRKNVARLESNGQLDLSFNPVFSRSTGNVRIADMVIDPSGNLLFGGSFTEVNGVQSRNAVRLDSDGIVDTSFTSSNTSSGINSLHVQQNGNVYVSDSSNSVACWEQDGSVSNDCNLYDFEGRDNTVFSWLPLPSGKLLVAGSWNYIYSGGFLLRLNADGSLDGTFNVADENVDPAPIGAAVLSTGKIVVGGGFNGDQPRKVLLKRFHENGELDSSFSPTLNSSVAALAPYANGSFLAGGYFTQIGDLVREKVARFGDPGDELRGDICFYMKRADSEKVAPICL